MMSQLGLLCQEYQNLPLDGVVVRILQQIPFISASLEAVPPCPLHYEQPEQ